ncbi:aminopeptidase n [Stylonychia lemnae]|uniref:Aminopeptidase n n=1 Tax=Stylonychia lemnae TaxID=5949 RepID=A0A078B0N8_STYLE|nr:aminopeptidase n [Stylonychia lemnae]|eukprot:CDW86678.1 aminopeptidase n [Stylonychia lemnae]
MSSDTQDNKILIAASLTTASALAQALYIYFKNRNPDVETEESESSTSMVDPAYGESRFITRIDAVQRASVISNLSYKIAVSLLKGGENFHGQVTINFNLSYQGYHLSLDYTGKEIKHLIINGHVVSDKTAFKDHKIYLQRNLLHLGQNEVKIRFVSAYVKDCQGLHYFKDPQDDREYLYSQCEAADAHKIFPCFDQPDLKAPYELLVFAPADWKVMSTKASSKISTKEELGFQQSILKFSVNHELYDLFGDEPFKAHEFPQSQKLSTYLYSLMAGPYEAIVDEDQTEIPQRVLCRQSLTEYVKKIAQTWFKVSIKCIKFYEKFFSTPWPFDKFDHLFVPDYNMGAMENVGMVIYTESYIQRDEVFTRDKQQGVLVTLLHEISHMWFGNLVTMKWWDDLWLNESFANFISYVCLDQADGLEEYDLAWSIFLSENFWGMEEDQQSTTHPIAGSCANTEEAQNLFDGISYGKGACFLRQLFFYFGDQVMRDGLQTYFHKFAYKNTVLNDFLTELGAAAKRLGIKEDLVDWSYSWLKSSGINIISYEYDLNDQNEILEFRVIQDLHHNGQNRLRKQKFVIALLDDNMQVIEEVEAHTSDKSRVTVIHGLAGKKLPQAFFSNYRCYGYGKFKIDNRSLKAFDEKLGLIKDSMQRKLLINTLNEMLKDQELSGSQFLGILKKHLKTETSDSVLSSSLQSYIPLYHEVFVLIVKDLLGSGRFENKTTLHLLVECAINAARNDEDVLVIKKWFDRRRFTLLDGAVIEHIEVSTKHLHSITKRIFSSFSIPQEEKDNYLDKLAEIDSSDWTQQTKYYCSSAIPTVANKQKLWSQYFDQDIEWQYSNYQYSFIGFNQVIHRHLNEDFVQAFFQRIPEIFKKKGRFIAESYFHYLQPDYLVDDENIQRYRDLLKQVSDGSSDNSHFINLIKNMIDDLVLQQKGKALSADYLESIKHL